MKSCIQKSSLIPQKPEAEIWNPEIYNKGNMIVCNDARELIKTIQEESYEKMDIIIDVGCGSGNITNMLCKAIPHQKTLACDISTKMIEFAIKTYNESETVCYVVQDFSVEWDKLDERIRELEGKANLVFCNYVIQLIWDKVATVNNIFRLLKKGGLFCLNIPAPEMFNEKEAEIEILKKEEHVNWLTKRQQFTLYEDTFLNAGFKISQSKAGAMEFPFPNTQEFLNFFGQVSKALGNSVVSPEAPTKVRECLLEKYAQLFLHCAIQKHESGINKTSNEESFKYVVDRYRFICRKK